MIEITDKTRCCGCGGCMQACPAGCILMQADHEGFLYPKADPALCTGCGACERVCPVINRADRPRHDVSTYAVRSKDHDNLINSTSGGLFKPLASYAAGMGGTVCAAAYDERFAVRHMFLGPEEAKADEAFSRFRGSKYVQSDTGDSFRKIKGLLREGEKVCFVGTPCQVCALKCFLGGDHENLITADLVCHGVISPALWAKYLGWQREKYSSDIISVSFRSKKYGYHSGGFMEISFESGETYRASARVDPILKSFFGEIASRPICYECPFRGLERESDITFYDCWHFSELSGGKKDDDKGYTNVIVQSEKGMEILNALKDATERIRVDTEKARLLDGVMIDGRAAAHPSRDEFYKDLDIHTIEEHMSRYLPVSAKDRAIERSKKMLYSAGILSAVKKRLK